MIDCLAANEPLMPAMLRDPGFPWVARFIRRRKGQ